MKVVIWLLFIITASSILSGFVLDVPYAQKLIGFGCLGLFFVVFPLFSYYRWKDKDVNDYMLTQENLDKMREKEERK